MYVINTCTLESSVVLEIGRCTYFGIVLIPLSLRWRGSWQLTSDGMSHNAPMTFVAVLVPVLRRGGQLYPHQVRFFAREAKQAVSIPPPPPHKYKVVGDAVRVGSALLGVGLIGYIMTLERTDEPHWTTQV